MDWTQTLTIIGTLGAFIFWTINRLDNDINKIHMDLREQGQRTDRLYEMFIDLLKEGRK